VAESSILGRVQRANLLAKQEAELEFQKQMTVSHERLTGAATAAAFDAATNAARLAKEVIESNKSYFPADQYRALSAQVNEQLSYIEKQKKQWEVNKVKAEQDEINDAKAKHNAKVKIDRQQKIEQLTRDAKVLRHQGEYGKSLEIIEQILILDSTNDWAADQKSELRQLHVGHQEKNANETRIYEEQKQAIDLRESEIPWYDILKYPQDWREKTVNRERFGVTAANESEADRAAMQKLRQRLPKLDFNDIEFQNVIQFLRDVGNTNIDVNWQALTAAGIEKSAKVNVHLTDVSFEKALRVVLTNVGGTTSLSFIVDEGVITISTKEDLQQKTISRVYDINDMIVRVPNFAGPVLNLQTVGGNSGNGGSSGGGGASGSW